MLFVLIINTDTDRETMYFLCAMAS